jgi:hypothetical protein
MNQCPKCNHKYHKYPIKGEDGKIIWQNLFKMDWMSIIFLVVILFLSYAYIHDTADCMAMREHPCETLAQSNCCEFIQDGVFTGKTIEQINAPPVDPLATPSYIKFNTSS